MHPIRTRPGAQELQPGPPGCRRVTRKKEIEMNINELINFVQENARDVADLAKAHDIMRLEQSDPWRKLLCRELRQKYEDDAETEERRDWFS